MLDFYPFDYHGATIEEGDWPLAVIRLTSGHLCGYVAIPRDECPAEWHGDYNADALQYLVIHGGLNFCDVGGNDKEKATEIYKRVRQEYLDTHAEMEGDDFAASGQRLQRYMEARKAADEAVRR